MSLNTDIVIDEAAFNKAISDFADLASELQGLRGDIQTMLETLKTGFDTPAGRTFIKSCEGNLLEPIDRQKVVIDHISETLKEAKGEYTTIFKEYDSLNASIKSYQS